MTGLYEQVFGNCALCGFNSLVVGGIVPFQMIGHDAASDSTAPRLVQRYRCRDRQGCERRQRDFPAERYRKDESWET